MPASAGGPEVDRAVDALDAAPPAKATVNNSRRLLAVVASLATLVVSGCSDDASTTTATTASSVPTSAPRSTTTTTTPTDPLIGDLCAVLNAAAGGELEVAKTTFDHGPLHTLAEEVIAIDRSVAARLLEAKEAVEADLAVAAPDGSALVTDVEVLVSATADALAATGTPAPPTCDPENQ